MTEKQSTATAGVPTPGRPARPIRDSDPDRNAAYWARIDAIVSTAPPLTDLQRAKLRSVFHRPTDRREAA